MNATEKKKYQKLLNDERSRLLDDLSKTNEHFIGQAAGEGDLVDVAQNSWERMINMGISDSELREIKEIEHAMRKLNQGKDYGQCEDCQSAILPARLEALPAARRCVTCQSNYDKLHKSSR